MILLLSTLAFAEAVPPEDPGWSRPHRALRITRLVSYGVLPTSLVLVSAEQYWAFAPLVASELAVLVIVPWETASIRRNTADGVTIAPMVIGAGLLVFGAAMMDPLGEGPDEGSAIAVAGVLSYAGIQPLLNHYALREAELVVGPWRDKDASGWAVAGRF
ncbi:MAG: hypothetical protein ACI8RZ_007426 [Myxococcota bacterium]|jgi:hypothetical protein